MPCKVKHLQENTDHKKFFPEYMVLKNGQEQEWNQVANSWDDKS
jgi:hypothetical protein